MDFRFVDKPMPPLTELPNSGAYALEEGIMDQTEKDIVGGLLFYYKLGISPTREQLKADIEMMYKKRWSAKSNKKYAITHSLYDAWEFLSSDWCGELTGYASPEWMYRQCVKEANRFIKNAYIRKNRIYSQKYINGNKDLTLLESHAYWNEHGLQKKPGAKPYDVPIYEVENGEPVIRVRRLFARKDMK